MREHLWRWRYLYGRPCWRRVDAERIVRLIETHGQDSRAVGNAIHDSVVWVPWWQRRNWPRSWA